MHKTEHHLPMILGALALLTVLALLVAQDARAAVAAAAMTAILLRILTAIVPPAMRRQEAPVRVQRR